MHGGIAHIAGNMLFLSIFGDNVEDRLGHFRFLLFYLVSGLVSAAAHILVCVITQDALLTPTLGASGAISGVMGAYLLLFPGNRVRVLLFNIIPTTVSAVVVIGLWFIFQLVNGMGYLGGTRGDGVAYAAHIGGFLYGFFRVRRYIPKRRKVRYYYY
jgi:membrane associated rhomboid family serine protease